MRVVAAVAADREGRATNEDEDVEAGGKTQEKEEEEGTVEERRRCKSNATFGGMKRRSVAVDVEGRRGDQAAGRGEGKRRVKAWVENDTEGNKNQTSTRHRTLTV